MSRQIIKVVVCKSRAVIAFYSNDGILTDPKFARYLQEDRDTLAEVEFADFVDHETDYVIANIRKSTQFLIDKLKTQTAVEHKDFLRKLFEASVENAAIALHSSTLWCRVYLTVTLKIKLCIISVRFFIRMKWCAFSCVKLRTSSLSFILNMTLCALKKI